jgi:hypothetical protein
MTSIHVDLESVTDDVKSAEIVDIEPALGKEV